MKTIVSAFVALSVLAAIAAPASAFDAKSFYAQLDRTQNWRPQVGARWRWPPRSLCNRCGQLHRSALV